MSLNKITFHKTIKVLESSSQNWDRLLRIIHKIDEINPYKKSKDQISRKAWKEQCFLNFPILYLTSIYIYQYAMKNGCDTILFATRDCSHLYQIFCKLYPYLNSHYFHCSRLMFEKATTNNNIYYNDYVSSIVKNVNKTLFIDIHGTGKRVINYFRKRFGKIPYCFLLSSGKDSYEQLPKISQDMYQSNRLINLVFGARGSPIEMLNYDKIGTLQDYNMLGPLRDNLEYSIRHIKAYHLCIHYLIKISPPIKPNSYYDLNEIHRCINILFNDLKDTKPVISRYIHHVGKHKITNDGILKHINFDKVINDNGVYGVVWGGSINNYPCAIKMVRLKSGYHQDDAQHRYKKSSTKPFIHELFDKHKSMSKHDFNYEGEQLINLSKLGLSTKVYDVTTFERNNISYGFIIMDRFDCSLKDIIQSRNLDSDEERIIYDKINAMHKVHFIIHGDMKPSNIGVNLNKNGKISECFIMDCQKVKYQKDLSKSKRKHLIKRDWENYFKHFKTNQEEGVKITNYTYQF